MALSEIAAYEHIEKLGGKPANYFLIAADEYPETMPMLAELLHTKCQGLDVYRAGKGRAAS